MAKKKVKKLTGRWVIPISKDLELKKEARDLASTLNVETRIATMKSGKFVLVRKQNTNDERSLDFMKWVRSFRYKNIKRIEK